MDCHEWPARWAARTPIQIDWHTVATSPSLLADSQVSRGWPRWERRHGPRLSVGPGLAAPLTPPPDDFAGVATPAKGCTNGCLLPGGDANAGTPTAPGSLAG